MSERYSDWGGPLISVGRFEWERIVRQCVFPKKYTKLVAFVLATYADTKTGANVRPGQKRLAIHTGISERAVRDHIRDLEEFGLIMLLIAGSSFGRSGKGMATLYQLTIPEQLDAWFKTAEDSLDIWDFDIVHIARSVEDQWRQATAEMVEQRKLASGVSDREWTVSPEVADISPEADSTSPEADDKNTGSWLPPTSALPLHEVNPQPTNPQGGSLTLSDVGTREATDNSPDPWLVDENLSLEDNRHKQMDALQKLIEAERKAS